MTATQLNLQIVDTPFDPLEKEKIVHYRMNGKTKLFKVWLSLDGADLIFVRHVRYILHPTFKTPEYTVERTIGNPTCQLYIYTWGVFEVRAVVQAMGENYELRRKLKYDSMFSEAAYSLPE